MNIDELTIGRYEVENDLKRRLTNQEFELFTQYMFGSSYAEHILKENKQFEELRVALDL